MPLFPDYPNPPPAQEESSEPDITPLGGLASAILGRPRSRRSLSTRSDLNKAATSNQERQLTVAADGAAIPLCYGRIRRGPLLGPVKFDGSHIVMLLMWGLGPWQEIETVLMDGKPVPSSVTLTHYLGTINQNADPTFTNLITNYVDTLVITRAGVKQGVAYTVARAPLSNLSNVPRFEIIAKTKKLHDPRSDTTVYSDNPSLALADFIRSGTFYGIGGDVPTADIIECANYNDELLSDGSKRRTIGVTFDTVTDSSLIIESLKTYAGVFLAAENGKLRMLPDRPTAVSRTITTSDFIKGSLRVTQSDRKNRPTVMRIIYTDTESDPWRDKDADDVIRPGVDDGSVTRVESTVRLPGFTSHQQAYREGIKRLNHLWLSDFFIGFTTHEKAIAYQVGEVHDVTHTVGIASKPMRLVASDPTGVAQWAVAYEEYDPAIYSDAIIQNPTYDDTGLPDPTAVPAITGLALVEEVYQTRAGIYASRIRATWDAIDYAYNYSYRVRVSGNSSLIFVQEVKLEEAVTSAIKEEVTYTVTVQAFSAAGFSGDLAQDTLYAVGKGLIPGDVPQVTVTQIGGGEALVVWQEAIDIDIWGYAVRLGSVWETAAPIDKIDALRLVVRDLPVGLSTILVKAIDSVGQFSVNATPGLVTITPPATVSGFTGIEVAGIVKLAWNATPASSYTKRYIIKYSASYTTWEAATLSNELDSLRANITDLPAGTYTFAIKAFDGVHESTTESTISVVVTSDADAYVADTVLFTSPTLTGIETWFFPTEEDNPTRYVTDLGDATGTLLTGSLSAYTNPLSTYHSSGASEWLSESYDYGSEITGTFILTTDAEALSGTVTKYLELSTNGVDWTQYATLTQQATARYIRARLSTATTSTVKLKWVKAQVVVEGKSESFTGTSLASGATTINLTGAYSKAISINVTITNSAGRYWYVDNILPGGAQTFDVYIFDGTDTQVACSFIGKFEGV